LGKPWEGGWFGVLRTYVSRARPFDRLRAGYGNPAGEIDVAKEERTLAARARSRFLASLGMTTRKARAKTRLH
jgi:hypothetical protein